MIYNHYPKIKNVAVCFSGEPRTYNLCFKSINNFFSLPNINVKYFAHTWNSNSYKTFKNGKVESDVEEYSIDFITNDIKRFYNFEKLNVEQKFENRPDNPWDNLFYSDAKSNLFKKEYEEQNNMIFDVVVKCRFDLAFNPSVKLTDLIHSNHYAIHEKTIYSELFLMTPEFYIPNIDDVFYYGSSFSMDIMQSNMMYVANNFYKELYNIHEIKNPYYNVAGPGVCMYRWLEQTHMTVHKTSRPFVIYRKSNIPMDPIADYRSLHKISGGIV
jgi:hypothetical protein